MSVELAGAPHFLVLKHDRGCLIWGIPLIMTNLYLLNWDKIGSLQQRAPP